MARSERNIQKGQNHSQDKLNDLDESIGKILLELQKDDPDSFKELMKKVQRENPDLFEEGIDEDNRKIDEYNQDVDEYNRKIDEKDQTSS